jgi:PAS domain-containing protein
MSAESPAPRENGDLLEYQNNPFDTDGKKASDVMRIFYQENLPLVPVVSRQNVLLGIITKERLTAAMSDIENFEQVKIDRFITSIAEKLTFEELLPMVKETKEFTVINIFGERTGNWSRIDLLEASDTTRLKRDETKREIEEQKSGQQIEWIIYMILEHIPRALYAVNTDGKTLFYNGYFEDEICNRLNWEDIDVEELEQIFINSEINDYIQNPAESGFIFYNTRLKLYYEKQPMKNNGKNVGYLIYCPKFTSSEISRPRLNGTLAELLEQKEREILVETLQSSENAHEAYSKLGLTKSSFTKKIKKFNITTKTD